ncbi:ABC transporter substrate-binding protein [Ruminococcaceae bacterium OttesenSCG-928-I18]|nr:ABC transporter substrate-binding protein [Ruminococcaceae bacterium OttesenSCG-928-I18]
MAKKVWIPVVALLLAAGLLAGCAGEAAPSASPAASANPAASEAAEPMQDTAGLEIKDMKDRVVTLEGPAERVVALSAADCEIVYALGAGDALVGRGEYCDYPEEVLDIPVVQSGNETNVEEIIALGPQVVLMNTMAQTTEQVQQLEDAGIAVLTSEATDIEGVYEAIGIIGAALGKDAEAEALTQEMTEAFSQIEQESAEAGGEKKTIYFEVSPLEYGLWTAGGGTFMDEIAGMLGLENLFADVDGWAEVSEEQVIERNPDYIVTITMYMGEGPKPDEEIAGRAGWEGIAAIQNGQVFAASEDELSRPGPRLVDGAKTLQNFVYGAETTETSSAMDSAA